MSHVYNFKHEKLLKVQQTSGLFMHPPPLSYFLSSFSTIDCCQHLQLTQWWTGNDNKNGDDANSSVSYLHQCRCLTIHRCNIAKRISVGVNKTSMHKTIPFLGVIFSYFDRYLVNMRTLKVFKKCCWVIVGSFSM